MTERRFVRVADAGALRPGSGTSVVVDGKTIALFNVDGRVYALEGRCLHRGGPVGEGELEGCVVTCPWHGWQYDVTTGRHTMDDSVGLERLEVRVEAGGIHVAV